MSEYVDMVDRSGLAACKGQVLIADLIRTIKEKSEHYCSENNISNDVSVSAVEKLDEGAIKNIHPACIRICTHIVGECVLVEGYKTQDPSLQEIATRAQQYVDILSVTAGLSPAMVHQQLTVRRRL